MNHILIAVVKPLVQKREIKHEVCLRIGIFFGGNALVIKTPCTHPNNYSMQPPHSV